MKLIIAEKPSVGFSIARALGVKETKDGYIQGGEYIITWCVGHLLSLADAGTYDEKFIKWNYADLPIIPNEWQFKLYGGKSKQFGVIKKLMNRKDVDSIVCATDAGREGELIFRFVYEFATSKKPFSRLWISSMEEAAIREGFANLKDGREYDNLYQSALCRAKADWLIGINATRLFSVLYRKTLNIGRVQTPTLKMIVDRDNDISFFKKEKYYTVDLHCGDFTAASEKIQDESIANEIKAACHNRQAVCVSVTKERKTEKPPKLFDLTTLQREANRIYDFTAKQTLDYAQSLYEMKLITYPRTDSRYLTKDMADTVANVTELTAKVPPFDACRDLRPDTFSLFNNEKVSDHHAIIPTVQIGRADYATLPNGEANILRLIFCKLLCAVHEPHVYEITTADFECAGKRFAAKGKTIVSEGWKEIERLLKYLLKDSETTEEPVFSLEIAEGQSVDVSASVNEHCTTPPKAYTEDTLLSAMEQAGKKETDSDAEHKGLGTPATRAAILEKLVKIGFVDRKDRKLTATKDGCNLVCVLPDLLTSPELTADWENTLTKIAKGQTSPEEFMQKIESMAADLVKNYSCIDKDKKDLFMRKEPQNER